jgi:hypothetical protein
LSFQANTRIVPKIKFWELLSSSFPNHCSSIVLSSMLCSMSHWKYCLRRYVWVSPRTFLSNFLSWLWWFMFHSQLSQCSVRFSEEGHQPKSQADSCIHILTWHCWKYITKKV